MWEAWIERYGYWAVLLGALLEGETTLLLAGYSLGRGYLDVIPTYLLAVVGGTAGDSLYYWLGRRFGPRLVRSRPALRPYRARATLLLRRWGHAAAFLSRFAYGLRVVLPLLMGATRMRPMVFHPYNLAASACFALLYLGIGFVLGSALDDLLDRMRAYETQILLGLIGLGALTWLVREWRIFHPKEPGDVLPPDTGSPPR